MELSFSTYLIVCPLVFLAGLIDSVAGGGGLISGVAYAIKSLNSNIKVYGVYDLDPARIEEAIKRGKEEFGIDIEAKLAQL